MTEATIRFFNIVKCGFYLRGHELPLFGGTVDTLTKISAWARDGRSISNTTCYQSDPENNIHDTFFFDGHRSEGDEDSILVLWNETPNDDGAIYGMLPTQAPGGTSMLTTRFNDPAAIPGQPSYFWFVPRENVFATIRFAHSLQGKTNLERYVNGFLANRSPYRIFADNDNIIGYSPDALASTDSARVYPAFHAIGHKTTELESELLTNLHRIRRFVKREELRYTVADDRNVIERTFSRLLPNAPAQVQARSISHEIQYQPTERELRQILANFSLLDESSTIMNAGFVYDDGKRIMLNGAYTSTQIRLDVQRADNQIVSPRALLTALNEHRQDLLRPIRNAEVRHNAEVI